MKFSNLQLTTPYLELPDIFFDKVEPTPLDNPFIISLCEDAAKLLDIDESLHVDTNLLEIINGSKKTDINSSETDEEK